MEPVISTDALTMRFKRCNALDGVDLQIMPGTVFALLGENGAGKTTLIRILTGFQIPTSGSCRVFNLDPTKDPHAVRRKIGYVSDSPALYDWMTVAEIGGFTGSFYDSQFVARYQEAIQRYEVPMHQKIRHLSKGQRAKVALSLSMGHDPALVEMDEPTSGLDPKVRKSFLESMIDRAAVGQTVFLSSHQIAEVERVADTIAILHRGKIRLIGSLAELRESIFHVVVDVEDPMRALPMLPAGAEVMTEQVDGRSREMFVRNLQPGMLDSIRSYPGVISVRQRLASLEEIFVACTSDRTPASGIDPPDDGASSVGTTGELEATS